MNPHIKGIVKVEQMWLKVTFTGVPGWLKSVWLLISAQVMISQFMSSSSVLGSVLSAWDSVSPSLSALPEWAFSLILSK